MGSTMVEALEDFGLRELSGLVDVIGVKRSPGEEEFLGTTQPSGDRCRLGSRGSPVARRMLPYSEPYAGGRLRAAGVGTRMWLTLDPPIVRATSIAGIKRSNRAGIRWGG